MTQPPHPSDPYGNQPSGPPPNPGPPGAWPPSPHDPYQQQPYSAYQQDPYSQAGYPYDPYRQAPHGHGPYQQQMQTHPHGGHWQGPHPQHQPGVAPDARRGRGPWLWMGVVGLVLGLGSLFIGGLASPGFLFFGGNDTSSETEEVAGGSVTDEPEPPPAEAPPDPPEAPPTDEEPGGPADPDGTEEDSGIDRAQTEAMSDDLIAAVNNGDAAAAHEMTCDEFDGHENVREDLSDAIEQNAEITDTEIDSQAESFVDIEGTLDGADALGTIAIDFRYESPRGDDSCVSGFNIF